MIDGSSDWELGVHPNGVPGLDPTISGGTIRVNSTAQFTGGGILKDVVVNGTAKTGRFSFNKLYLVGDVDFNGSVITDSNFRAPLQFGHDTRFAGVPLIIRGGLIDFGLNSHGTSITGSSGPPSVTFESDVVLKGRKVNATFATPLTNRGQIIADQQFPFTFGDVFHFTAAPITNEGTLSAVNRSILRIANLAAPNSGIVSAGAGSSVEFTSTFAQAAAGTTRVDIGGTAATQFGLVAVTGAATLAGTLNVQFASGHTPAVGNTFKVLTYASRTGMFTTVNVTGLASGLTVTPQYTGSDLTLVVEGTAAGLMANLAPEGEPNSLATEDTAIEAAIEQLFLHRSKRRSPAASTRSDFPIDLIRSPTAGNPTNSIGKAQDSGSEYQPLTKRVEGGDDSAATDEIFARIGHKLLWTRI
jgi:hypothetical protein